jgi:hypothetical protein
LIDHRPIGCRVAGTVQLAAEGAIAEWPAVQFIS